MAASRSDRDRFLRLYIKLTHYPCIETVHEATKDSIRGPRSGGEKAA
jgi:hypothetical protein